MHLRWNNIGITSLSQIGYQEVREKLNKTCALRLATLRASSSHTKTSNKTAQCATGGNIMVKAKESGSKHPG